VRQTPALRKTDLPEAEYAMSKHVTWDMVTFVLNSLVFLLLGLQLPGIFVDVWNNSEHTHLFLALCAVLVTLILLAVRFLSLAIFAADVGGATPREKLKNTLLLTLSGVKGAVSLATAFALPITYVGGFNPEHRSLLLFITAGAIILSLLMALTLLPVVADSAKNDRSEGEMRIAILREVIAQLRARAADKAAEGRGGSARAVVKIYRERVRAIEDAEFDKREKKAIKSLWRLMYRTEKGVLDELQRTGELDDATRRNIRDMLFLIYGGRIRGAAARAGFSFISARFFGGGKRIVGMLDEERRHAMLDRLTKNEAMLARTFHEGGEHRPERLTDRILHERRAAVEEIKDGMLGRRTHDSLRPGYADELINGFYVERRVIHQFLERGEITSAQANALRGDVNRLELYALSEKHGESAPMIRLFARLREKRGER
jgi:CPA1 family monovalent cation:H+ antiporter